MESYRIVFISLTSFTLFISLAFLLRKHKNYPALLVIFSSLLPLFSLLRKGVHQSGDFALHIERAIDLWSSLTHGVFPVHWAALLNLTYGYPLFIFIYPLPYYSLAFLKLLGVSFILAEKILIAVTFTLSGIGMYKLARIFLERMPSALSSVLYLFAPYHLVDMHFRVALGELFSYAILPFVFYFALKISKRHSVFNFFACAFCYAALLLSHPAMSIVSTPFIFTLPFFLKKNSRTYTILSLITGMLLSSFYILPAVFEMQFSLQNIYGKSISFENPLLYFISPWRYGFLYQGPTGQLSFPMGFVQLFLLGVSVVLLKKRVMRKIHKKVLIVLLFVFLGLFFLLLPISFPVWKILPFMTNFQFAYRLLLPISFVLSFIGGICAEYLTKKIVAFILFLAILATILNWGTRGVISNITDEYLIRHAPISTSEGEGLQGAVPRWRDNIDLWFEKSPVSHLALTEGKAVIKETERTPVNHKYFVETKGNSFFVENTLYFPGWTLYINGKKHPFHIDNGKSGLIQFSLPKGTYRISLRFEDTLPRIIGNIVSAITFVIASAVLGYHFVFQRRK
jgi:hypothetical protein